MCNRDNNEIDAVMSRVLAPAGLEERHLSRSLDSIMTRDIDIADLYFQISRQESWVVEDGIIKTGNFNLSQGVGVRAAHLAKRSVPTTPAFRSEVTDTGPN